MTTELTPMLSVLSQIQLSWLGLFLGVTGLGAVYLIVAKLVKGGLR